MIEVTSGQRMTCCRLHDIYTYICMYMSDFKLEEYFEVEEEMMAMKGDSLHFA